MSAPKVWTSDERAGHTTKYHLRETHQINRSWYQPGSEPIPSNETQVSMPLAVRARQGRTRDTTRALSQCSHGPLRAARRRAPRPISVHHHSIGMKTRLGCELDNGDAQPRGRGHGYRKLEHLDAKSIVCVFLQIGVKCTYVYRDGEPYLGSYKECDHPSIESAACRRNAEAINRTRHQPARSSGVRGAF